LIALVLLLLAYPVLGTVALWSGLVERVLASEDLRVEIENPAYTLWPGRIHMQRVRIACRARPRSRAPAAQSGLSASL
jgi:hypothetical protein